MDHITCCKGNLRNKCQLDLQCVVLLAKRVKSPSWEMVWSVLWQARYNITTYKLVQTKPVRLLLLKTIALNWYYIVLCAFSGIWRSRLAPECQGDVWMKTFRWAGMITLVEGGRMVVFAATGRSLLKMASVSKMPLIETTLSWIGLVQKASKPEGIVMI